MRRITCILGTALLLVSAQAFSQPCNAQQTVHLHLQIDGNDIEGESTMASMDREGTIECIAYEDGVSRPGYDEGLTTASAVHEPIVCIKRIDKTTPLLWKALELLEPVTGTFRFFRPSPGGSGAEEHYYTVLIEDARIIEINTVSRKRDDLLGDTGPAYEVVTFAFPIVTKTYEIGGATYKNQVLRRRGGERN